MADDIDKIFKEIELEIFDFAQTVPYREAVKIFKKARRFAEGSTDEFFSILSSRYMDINQSPSDLGVTWHRLTARWRNYKTYVLAGLSKPRGKKQKGAKRELRRALNASSSAGNDRFYYGIGEHAKMKKKMRGPRRPHLKDLVAKLSVEKVLGKPEVTMDKLDDSPVFLTQNAPNAVPRVRDLHSGKFANTQNLEMEVAIEVYLTPRLKGQTTRALLEALVGGNPQFAEKITRLERLRPLFRPYLIWYIDKKAQELARKMVR